MTFVLVGNGMHFLSNVSHLGLSYFLTHKGSAVAETARRLTHTSRVPCTKVLSQKIQNFQETSFCVLQVSLLDFTNTIWQLYIGFYSVRRVMYTTVYLAIFTGHVHGRVHDPSNAVKTNCQIVLVKSRSETCKTQKLVSWKIWIFLCAQRRVDPEAAAVSRHKPPKFL